MPTGRQLRALRRAYKADCGGPAGAAGFVWGEEQVPKRCSSVGTWSSKRPPYAHSGPSRWGLSVPADPSCSGQISTRVSHNGFTTAWEKLPTSTDTSQTPWMSDSRLPGGARRKGRRPEGGTVRCQKNTQQELPQTCI